MCKKSIILTSFTSLALLMGATAQAKIYKWQDANGQTHYTAQPPTQAQKGIKATNIEDKIKARSGKYRPPKKVKSTGLDDADSSKTENDDQDNALSGPDKQLIKYCKGQRENLKQLRNNFRNIWIDASGKETKLSQEQRKEKVATIQNEINSNCSEVKY